MRCGASIRVPQTLKMISFPYFYVKVCAHMCSYTYICTYTDIYRHTHKHMSWMKMWMSSNVVHMQVKEKKELQSRPPSRPPRSLTILECVINCNDSLEGFGEFGSLCWAEENHKGLQPFNYWILSVIQDSQGAKLEERSEC